jgi:hypothetical protein
MTRGLMSEDGVKDWEFRYSSVSHKVFQHLNYTSCSGVSDLAKSSYLLCYLKTITTSAKLY